MHGNSFLGDGNKAILDLSAVITYLLGSPDAGS
jgi:hypothetical protein